MTVKHCLNIIEFVSQIMLNHPKLINNWLVLLDTLKNHNVLLILINSRFCNKLEREW